MKKTKIIAGSIAMSILCSLTLNYRASTTVAEDYAESSATHSKITEQLEEKMINSVSEEIPVVIWYDGVDNEVVENSVIDEIGYGIDSLEEQYTKPDDELISELSKAANGDPDKYLEFLMKNYLNMTEETRAIEKDKTETYRRSKREKYKEYNLKDARALINDLEISNDDISFVSSYAPMIVCSLDMNTIDQVSKNDRISEIDFYEELKAEECSINMGTTKNSMGITDINNCISLDGSGVKLGIYDIGSVELQYLSNYGLSSNQVHYVFPTYYAGTTHSTYCAGIAAGSQGIAPNADIYSASSNNDMNLPSIYSEVSLQNLESLINTGVDVISTTFSTYSGSTNYNYFAKYTDFLIANTNTTIVSASGNNPDEYIPNPATAYNCISVTGFLDTFGDETNVLNNYTYNNGNGCLKPDVVGPSLSNGTSSASPYIAGMIALMYQYKPSLAASPETTKAILLASCHEKCNKIKIGGNITNLTPAETMYSGLTDRQGAGIANMYRMISIVSQHTYGNGVLNNSNNYSRTVKFLQPSYNSGKINVSMAYLQTDVPSGNVSGTLNNYDISLVNNGTTKYSNKSNSSTEMVYENLTSDPKYTLNITKVSGNTNTVRYAYAWSTNNEHYYNNYDNEGVYYLKNLNSSYYLKKNTNNSYTSQGSFSNSNNLLWVLDKPSSSSDYVLKNANITSNGLGFGSLIETDDYYAIEGSNASTQQIEVIFDQNTGTYSFVQTRSGIDYALGIYNNSTSSGSYADWRIYSPNNTSQKWHLEKANYRRGDVDLDGSITTADATAVLNYYAYLSSGVGTNPFKNIQIFLADVNCDGIVNSVDSSLIASMAA